MVWFLIGCVGQVTAVQEDVAARARSADTGSVGCTVGDLALRAEVWDAGGASGSIFTVADPLSMVGVLTNTCAGELDLELPDPCFVEAFRVSDGREEESFAPACAGQATELRLGPGEAAPFAMPWGTLPAGTWTLELDFVMESEPVRTGFEVR